ncbi:hypothetical protein [Maricaulis sp.]|uniref:hypothetical protein n=1 Tax=Maricaulis sp. TaxID=1486257 RepID=UPI002B26DEE4|nr:hypothetical protein [Maricaulis sp.]
MLKNTPTILLIALIGATPLLAAAEPAEDGRYAAIFPPGWQARDVVLAAAEAGQSTLNIGRAANIGVFQVPGPEDRRALREAGAWLVLPASAFRGCLIDQTSMTAANRFTTESPST